MRGYAILHLTQENWYMIFFFLHLAEENWFMRHGMLALFKARWQGNVLHPLDTERYEVVTFSLYLYTFHLSYDVALDFGNLKLL